MTELINESDIKILIVDDEEPIRIFLEQVLIGLEYCCLVAQDGLEALRLIEQNDIDLVIADIAMPHVSGIELTEIIKEKHSSDVILMTGFVENFTYEEIIAKGASDFIKKPFGLGELIVRVKRVLKEREILAERNRAMYALKESKKRYKELSITDGLTNLYNSRHFYAQLKSEIERVTRYNHPITLLVLDVDNFKHYNDTFGHLEGDNVLIRLADIIRKSLRETDSAYRYGGEEFVVILPETKGDEGIIVAERIRIFFAEEAFVPTADKTEHVTVSVGVAEFVPHETLTDFIKRTDQSMFKAKKKGKNRTFLSPLKPQEP